MANFKYGNPYTPGTAEFYAYQNADVAPDLGFSMAPRIAGPRPELGLAPYGPGYASTYPNPGGVDSGQDLPMMYGYESTIGVPQAQVDPMSISPGGTNEIVGAPQTDYSGGFDTSAMTYADQGMFDDQGGFLGVDFNMDGQRSEIGAPVTETHPSLGRETPQARQLQGQQRQPQVLKAKKEETVWQRLQVQPVELVRL